MRITISILTAGIVTGLFVVAGCDRIGHPAQAAPVAAPISQTAPSTVVDPRVTYELREKCGRESREWFKHFYGDGTSKTKDYEGATAYTNHYNSAQNRCFVLLRTTGFSRDAKTNKVRMSDDRNLIDVSENRTIGDYFRFTEQAAPMQCNLAGKDCGSQNEWDALVAPYMDN